LSSSDLVHLVCEQCGKQEVCPANLLDQHEPDAFPNTGGSFSPEIGFGAEPATTPKDRPASPPGPASSLGE
jgi:hypothetical protein